MHIKVVCLVGLAMMSCSGGDGTTRDAGVDTGGPDAPETLPTLTSFGPMPMQVAAGVPSAVMWNWTYLVDPPYPPPVCTIDNGVGEVTRGQTTMVTLTATTTFRLSCANRAGMTARDTVITIPNAPPTISTFTATPNAVPGNAATDVTFSWTYSGFPNPPPTCTIEGLGSVTSGTAASVTLTQSRTYRLTCTNSTGSSSSYVTINVNECTAGTHDCGANATCVDTVNGFSCACNTGYTGNGDTCSLAVDCTTTPGACSPDANCVAGTSCQCKPGYIGDGATCTRQKIAFTTSTTGNGIMSGWAGATGSGIAAADSVCRARAAAAGLPGTCSNSPTTPCTNDTPCGAGTCVFAYVAWMSDSLNDAYCRVHGLGGKKSANCGQLALPTGAGPWVRPVTGLPVAPTIDKLLAPTRATYLPASFNELGTEITTVTDRVFTGTDDNGVLTSAACSDWTGTSGFGAMGEVNGGGTSWTDLGTDPSCLNTGHLRCMEVGTGGGALPSRHPIAKKAFLTSVSGTGNLSTWAEANGLTGTSAADAVCQARARYAGYLNSQNFKAWMSGSSSASSRIITNGPWARPDGIVIATSESDLLDGKLAAPLYLTELNSYAQGNSETGDVWTGTYYYGSSTFNYCSAYWSQTAGYVGTSGHFDLVDPRWANFGTTSCVSTQRLYCVED